MTELTYYVDRGRHLVCLPYSVDNLHLMAADLGIKRCWFHGDHYDVPKRRVDEVDLRCKKVSTRTILTIIKVGRIIAD